MLIQANALALPIRADTVQCVVTSPPYWGLRDYGVPGQLGLESTPDLYVANMVAVFREVWRVLREDGTLWLNLGDSYNNFRVSMNGQTVHGGELRDKFPGRRKVDMSLKEKDLVGIPWRVAFALQADGWYLRSDIIWSKPNPMPESVTDRPTKAHEYLFLLAKSERYYYDADAVRENYHPNSIGRYSYEFNPDTPSNQATKNPSTKGGLISPNPAGRNNRSVWTIATAPYSGAHFATYPPALVEPCIKAGTSERGCCPKCGQGWVRDIDRVANYEKRQDRGQPSYKSPMVDSSGWKPATVINHGFAPACTCDAGDPVPAVVLDPFAGSGTTLMVARSLGRHAVGLDLSLPYLRDQARSRLSLSQLEAWTNGRKDGANLDDLPLFQEQP